MHKTFLTMGIALMLAGIAASGEAYHIKGNTTDVPCNGATTTHDWCLGAGVLIICEQDDFLDSAFLNDELNGIDPSLGVVPVVATPGQGGLCVMSAGHGDVGCTSLKTLGRSDGHGYLTTVGGEDPGHADCPQGPAAGTYYEFAMTGGDGDVAWTAQAGPAQCDDDVNGAIGQTLIVDELFLFWTDNGHLAGFPNTADRTNTTATWGSYTVSSASAPSTPTCDASLAAAPMYIV